MLTSTRVRLKIVSTRSILSLAFVVVATTIAASTTIKKKQTHTHFISNRHETNLNDFQEEKKWLKSIYTLRFASKAPTPNALCDVFFSLSLDFFFCVIFANDIRWLSTNYKSYFLSILLISCVFSLPTSLFSLSLSRRVLFSKFCMIHCEMWTKKVLPWRKKHTHTHIVRARTCNHFSISMTLPLTM